MVIIKNEETYEGTLKVLKERGVNISDISKIVYDMQIKYNEGLSLDFCEKNVYAVLKKREIQHAVLVGLELDILAEKGLLSEPLLSIISSDDGLFGIDETLAIGGCFSYGSVALTTFGYLDKEKTGIIKEFDESETQVNTFLDDIVAMIAACASARVAHKYRDEE